MNDYIININDLVVNDQSIQYNFLCEMYPIIDTLYSKLWFYENIASMKEEIKIAKINELKEYISVLLKAYNIPESIILTKMENNYIEPISNVDFKIGKNVHMQLVEEEIKDTYMINNETNSFFKHDIPKFKELTKTMYKKRQY